MSKVQKSARGAVAAATIVISLFGMAGVASAAGKPAVGSVGNADLKTPGGQSADDHNNGYRCDGNKGVGQGNPAHNHNCGDVVVVL
jgi:hypothetical protein